MSTTPLDRVWPKKIIVDTTTMMQAFEETIYPLPLMPADYREIVTQIVDLLLNFGTQAAASYSLLPDMSRLVTQGIQDDHLTHETLMRASQELAAALHCAVVQLGAIQYRAHGEDFPYYLVGFHGRDLVLEHLPY